MGITQKVADQVAFALNIAGMIDHFEDFGDHFSYVTDDGRVLTVMKKGTYTFKDIDERLIQSGRVNTLLSNPNR